MAKQNNLKVTGIKASSMAMFEGTFFAVIGLGVAILYSLNQTLELAQSTNSVLTGLAFGLGTGIVSVIVLPLAYFGFGWVLGYIHGWVFNTIAETSGGIVLHTED